MFSGVQLSTTLGTSKARDSNEGLRLPKPPVREAHIPWLPPPTNRREGELASTFYLFMMIFFSSASERKFLVEI